LIILGEQPIRIGDLVEVDGLHANIEHIGPRSTRVRTGSNLEIIIPNSRFLENNVTNWTLSNNEIRVCVKVGVAYGSPVEQVMTLLQQAVDEEPRVLDHPDAIILFDEFADNSLNFEVHFWVRMRTIMEGRRAESEVRKRIDQLFREHDITIAFPQRDVHLDLNRPIEISMADPNVASKLSHIRRAA
jgi:small-conductance mechanosensitive channel